MRQCFNNLLLAVAFCAVAFLFGSLGEMTFNRESPVYLISAKAVVPEVPAGGDLPIEYHVYRFRRCDAQLERRIFDAKGTSWLLDTTSKLAAPSPLGEETFVRSVQVPKEAAPGRAVYRLAASFACNPVQRLWPIVALRNDVSFIITPAEQSHE